MVERSKPSVRDTIAAKAALPPFSKQEWVLWLSFVVFVQSLWGLWPVCTRYLQTIPPDPSPTLQLTLMVNAIALPCTIILTYLPTITAALWTLFNNLCFDNHQQQKEIQQQQTYQQSQITLPTSGNGCKSGLAADEGLNTCHAATDVYDTLQGNQGRVTETMSAAAESRRCSPDVVSPDNNDLVSVVTTVEDCCDVRKGDSNSRTCQSRWQQWSTSSNSNKYHATGDLEIASAVNQQQQQQQQGWTVDQKAYPGTTWKRKVKSALMSQLVPYFIGILAASYNIAIIYSARFINAYLVQLISMFTPLIVALCSSYLLKEETPPGLYITLVLALGGSAMVVSGHWLEHRSQLTVDSADGKQAVLHLIIGLVLSVVTVIFQAAYTLAIQVFRKSTTSQRILIANRNASILFCLPFAFGLEDTSWRWLQTLRPADWGVLMFGSIVIYTFNTLWLTVCTRRVGANMFSIFVSMRLVASVVGSVVLLHSTPHSPVTWAGFGVVLVVMTAFLLYQQRHGKQAPAAAGDASAAESVGGQMIMHTEMSSRVINSSSNSSSNTK